MADVPVVQILEKKSYFKQAIVPLPNALPLPSLGESSLRIRTELLCITANNATYCKVGDVYHWWDVHPIPPSAPAEYSDPTIYGRTNCWGYAKVIDSTFGSVPKGSYVWGYLPLGTLPLDLQVKQGNVPDQVIVTDDYRQKQIAIYNRYLVFPASLGKEIEAKASGVAYDSLIRVMHLTAYLIQNFMFPSDPTQSVTLKPEEADLADATVINFAPASKVGLSLAYLLRHQRQTSKPRRVVGAASEHSIAFARATQLYDEVAPTSTDPLALLSSLGVPQDGKVVLFDFGGRAGVGYKWFVAIKQKFPRAQLVFVGMEVTDPAAAAPGSAPPKRPEGDGIAGVHAGILQDLAMGKVGEVEYFRGLNESWEGLRKDGFSGFTVTWGQGMADVGRGWDKFAKNEARADEGLVFTI
ncbi:hypothetical protein GGR54DRAFT_112849 [Hypoxylon sp. NC1633]|nr:hypothetical protein GGR54DRAFT_112849 [Hypoxylon sp. NC1633]